MKYQSRWCYFNLLIHKILQKDAQKEDFRNSLDPFWGFILKTVPGIHDPRISGLPFGTKNHEMRGPPVAEKKRYVFFETCQQCMWNFWHSNWRQNITLVEPSSGRYISIGYDNGVLSLNLSTYLLKKEHTRHWILYFHNLSEKYLIWDDMFSKKNYCFL